MMSREAAEKLAIWLLVSSYFSPKQFIGCTKQDLVDAAADADLL